MQLTFYSNSAEIFRQRGDILRANSTHHSSQVPWGSFPGSKLKLITPRTAETRNAKLPRKHKRTNTSVHWKHLLLRQLICVNFNQLKRSGYLSSQYPTPNVCSTIAERESKFSGEGETLLTMTEDLWMSEPVSLSTGGGAENTGRSSSSSSLVSSQSSSRLPLDPGRLCFLFSDCLLLENQILTTSLNADDLFD